MEIKFIVEKLNSKIEMIDEQIHTYATRIAKNKYIFQCDDNVAVHTAKAKQNLQAKTIRV